MSVTTADNLLGSYLKDRRTRLDPTAFGFSGRRRTPGLRREEVAQRASISSTWYMQTVEPAPLCIGIGEPL